MGGLLDTTSLCDCTAPFIVQIVTDNTPGAGDMMAMFVQRGVCLEYKQVPCN